MNKLRRRILTRLAQAQPTQPEETTPTMPALSPVSSDVFSHLNEGYNGPTVTKLTNMTHVFNAALHYASSGKKDFQDIINNTLESSGLAPDAKNVGSVVEQFYDTFLNGKNAFTKKVDPKIIINWADAITNSPGYANLSQINPTGPLAIKLQKNLKNEILSSMTEIKNLNPTIS